MYNLVLTGPLASFYIKTSNQQQLTFFLRIFHSCKQKVSVVRVGLIFPDKSFQNISSYGDSERKWDRSLCLSQFLSQLPAAKSQLTTKNQPRVQVLEFRLQIWSDIAWDNREEESYKKIGEKADDEWSLNSQQKINLVYNSGLRSKTVKQQVFD